MFERYEVYSSKFVEIPLPKGKEKLYMSEDGQVLSHEKGLLPIGYDEQGFKTVVADLWLGLRTYRVALITLVTYKKIKLQTQYYDLVEPFHIDGDKNNSHPANIGYRYTQPIECEVKPGFYYIPFFNHYVINRQGVLYNWITDRRSIFYVIKPTRTSKGRYRTITLKSDRGMMRIGRYRLLALVFLPYPNNVDKLYVNHIDGNGGNDDLLNLEWVTPKRNRDHAFETGLCTQNKPLLARNVFTGEERTFYSAQEAGRQLGAQVHVVCRRLKDVEAQKIYTGGWLFKTDPNQPWRDVKDPHAELRALSNPTKVFSKNVFTGEIREHESITQVGFDLGLEKTNAPKFQIKRKATRPYFGYLFKTADDTTPWPEFSERELAIFRENPSGHARGVVARNTKGEELFFTNIKHASKHFQHILKSKNDVIKAIARKRVVDDYRLYYY